MRKNQANWDRGTFYNMPDYHSLFKTIKVIKNKEGLRNCHSQEGPKQTKHLNALCVLDGVLEQEEDERETPRKPG